MKILTLCYEYPPLGGGAGRAAKSIAEELAARGHQVRFLTGGMPHLPANDAINGVAIQRVRSFRRHEESCSVWEMGLFLVASFLPAVRCVWSWRPDVLHVHLAVPTGALALAIHLISRMPYVLTVHLGDVPGAVPEQTALLYRFLNPFIRPIWRRAARISAVSEFVRRLAISAYGHPVMKIPNAIDLSGGSGAAPRLGTPMQLVCAGRFNPQKNFLLLVDACAALGDLPWHLTMIGDGVERAAVREKLARLGLLERVTLTGWLPAPEVEARLASADIFVIPSSVEGLSMAALEALKHGLAIIGSDIGGMLDVIEEGVNGWRVPPGNVPALAAALRALLTDPTRVLRMKAESRRKAGEFDRETIAAQYEQLLLDAVASAPR